MTKVQNLRSLREEMKALARDGAPADAREANFDSSKLSCDCSRRRTGSSSR